MLNITKEKRDYDEISEIPDGGSSTGDIGFSSAEGGGASPVPTKVVMEQEKRIRREIANSNERRRMQSINAGFQTLRSLLPRQEGEKLSKAAILQQTSDFIYSLEQEKARLLTQNCQLKRLLGQQQQPPPAASSGAESDAAADSPSSARRSVSQESAGEEARPGSAPVAPASPAPAPAALEPLRLQLLEVRAQLDQEQRVRRLLEERLREAEQASVKQEISFEEEMTPQHHELPSPCHQELSAPIHHELVTRHHELPTPHRQLPSPKYHTLSSPQQQQQQQPAEARSPLPLHLASPRHHSAPLPQQPQQTAVYEPDIPAVPRDRLCPAPAGREVHLHFKKPRLEIPSVEDRLAPAPQPQPQAAPQQMVLPSAQLTERTEEVFVQHRPLYLSSATSRQNLNTIVEAIRHLEGDHLFRELAESSASPAAVAVAAPPVIEERLTEMEALEPQDAPLELTTHARSSSHGEIYHRP